MISISFIFSYNNIELPLFGKLLLNILDPGERIDLIVKKYVRRALKDFLNSDPTNLLIGILGTSNDFYCDTDDQILFALYIIERVEENLNESYYCYIEDNDEYVFKYYSFGDLSGTIDKW